MTQNSTAKSDDDVLEKTHSHAEKPYHKVPLLSISEKEKWHEYGIPVTNMEFLSAFGGPLTRDVLGC